MTEPYPWFGVVETEQLEQGDLLLACPVFRIDPDGKIRRDTADVVVLSHSCDLANDKLEFVQVCPYWPLESLAARVEYLRGRKGREDLRRGNLPGYHLLNRCALPGNETDFLVLDFRSLLSVHLQTVKELAGAQRP